MNYREFTERVYNYKHGIKTVADDQSNSIEHSARGDEWDSHKYKEKIYLGEGKYRYIYEDGTSSTGYKPLDYNDPARQQQRAKPLVDNFNARVETRETAQGISNKLALDNQIQQGKAQEAERKEAGTMSESYKTANGIGDFLKTNVQSPSNRDFANARKEAYDAENKAKAPQAAPSAPVPYAQQDKEIAAGKSEEEKRKAAGTPNASVAGKVNTAVTANNIGSFLRNNINNPQNATNGVLPDAAKSTNLGSTATGIADALANKKEGRTEGTPYSQLTAQSVAATNNPSNTAQNIADSYMSEISHLKDFATRAGMSEAEFWKIIDSYETVYGGEPIASSLNGVDRNNINWMEGADTGMQNYMSNVLPKIQEGIADRMNRMPAINQPSEANTEYQITDDNRYTWKNNIDSAERSNLIRGIMESYIGNGMPAEIAAQLSFGDSYAKSFAIGQVARQNPGKYDNELQAVKNGDLDIMNIIYETDPEVRAIADNMFSDMVAMWPDSEDYVLKKLFGYGK